jgi:hypothetical protein
MKFNANTQTRSLTVRVLWILLSVYYLRCLRSRMRVRVRNSNLLFIRRNALGKIPGKNDSFACQRLLPSAGVAAIQACFRALVSQAWRRNKGPARPQSCLSIMPGGVDRISFTPHFGAFPALILPFSSWSPSSMLPFAPVLKALSRV